MLQFLRTYRNLIIAFGLVLLSSLVWISNTKTEKERNVVDRGVVWVSSPLVRAITWVSNGVRDIWNNYVWFVGLRDEYDGALLENQVLRSEVNRLKEQELENERLRGLLGLSREVGGKDIAAKVIGVDDVIFARTIRINKGYREGIRRNMPVITRDGVVGRVTKARGGSAEVMLITDPNSSVAVRIQRSRAQGILDGTGAQMCELQYVSRDADAQKGDIVITAGIEQPPVFPAGVPVGRVVSVQNKHGAVTKDIRVETAVNFERLPDEVLVLIEIPSFPSADEDEIDPERFAGTKPETTEP